MSGPTTRKGQIVGALDLLWTGLTGTRKEIAAKFEPVAEDALEQVKRARRPLNRALETKGETVEDADEDDKDKTDPCDD